MERHKTKREFIEEIKEMEKVKDSEVDEKLQEIKEAEHRFQQKLKILNEFSNDLSMIESFDELCRQAVELGCNLLGFERLSLWFISKDPHTIIGSFGIDANGKVCDERDRRLKIIPGSMMGQVLSQKLPLAFWENTALHDKRGEVIGRGTHAIAALWNGKEVIGHLSADNLIRHDPITKQQRELLTLYASALGHLCSRQKVEEKLKQSLDKLQKNLYETIYALSSIVKIKDPYTAEHQWRVAHIASVIAQDMGLAKEQVETIRIAGIVHDIGKISVPAEILNKPGQLSSIELEMIRTHPSVSYNILKDIDFPGPVKEVVFQHHERIDGSGYPEGLTGKDMLLETKIIGVSDVVEAIASHRPYRPSLGIDKSIEEISQYRDTLYDSKVVDTCLNLLTTKRFKFN